MIKSLKALVLAICCAAVIVPFFGIIATSLSSREDVTRAGGFVMFPSEIRFDAYEAILSGGVVTRATVVSLLITLVGTALSLVATTLLAYGLSRRGTLLHRPMLAIVLLPLLFTPGIIPSYLIVKYLGLLDTYWSLILPVVVNAFNVIVLRAFFMELPQEVMDSARIDGAGDFTVLWRIVLPMSKAVLAVIALFYAVAYWNSFFNALLYINDTAKWPLQLVLRTYVVNQAELGVDQLGGTELPPREAVQMAILVLSIIPILLVYPFVQRHFTKGVLVGAVKG
ncbi:carbohydrate ABC transporter permease [Kibdelosporangium persicum]|uniref:Binding-protein-dependent transport systems inner membrane component n=1 Tax=Kibdelosporangium persicum TaxID=2698649 RepID=A0ABX2F0E3_9PSEU|nr:carbohydrate ABC transporter permease [Kibdelosporangium persicum]NRN64490.1 Binding-protein-dependent transport systems inner membrane component [Kibdelosporangium persicum]